MFQRNHKWHAGTQEQSDPRRQFPVKRSPNAALQMRRTDFQIHSAKGADKRSQQHQQNGTDRSGGHACGLSRPSTVTPPIISTIPAAFQIFMCSWKKYSESKSTQI